MPRLRWGFVFLVAVLAAPTSTSADAVKNGPLPALFPADNWWNLDISLAPVDPHSAAFINYIGPTRGLHPDFGGLDPGNPPDGVYGFPYAVVSNNPATTSVSFDYADESDPGPYPIPVE